jgi:hypothetical protein
MRPRESRAMASSKPLNDYFKVVVFFEHREDGGLRAYSDDVPGFVLSHSDRAAVLADVKPALETILSDMFSARVAVSELPRLRERLTLSPEDAGPIPPKQKEYVTHRT